MPEITAVQTVFDAAVEAAARAGYEDPATAPPGRWTWDDLYETTREQWRVIARRQIAITAPIIAAYYEQAAGERIALAIEAKADALNIDDELENELILTLEEAATIARNDAIKAGQTGELPMEQITGHIGDACNFGALLRSTGERPPLPGTRPWSAAIARTTPSTCKPAA